jgi:hypothetical protein
MNQKGRHVHGHGSGRGGIGQASHIQDGNNNPYNYPQNTL